MTYRLTEDELRHVLDRQTLQRGRAVWAYDRVRQVDASADGLRISGSVQGSQRQPYNQAVSLVPSRGGRGVRVIGYCTCPMGLNCKHVAAVLLEHCARLDKTEAPPPDPQTAALAGSEHMALPKAVADWIDRLGAAVAPPDTAPRTLKHNQRQLRFILNHADAPTSDAGAAAWIRPVSVRFKKDGAI